MTSTELLILLPIAALGLLLWNNLRAREAALASARALCKSEGLLFLDDTVAMQSLRPVRDSRGRLRLQRVFVFEYSDTGNNRREGAASVERCLTFTPHCRDETPRHTTRKTGPITG